MTIRNMSRRPCPDCKEETLHDTNRCTCCGRIDLTHTQARMLGNAKRMAVQVIARGRVGAANYMRKRMDQTEFDRREWQRRTGNRSKDLPSRRGD